jgi:choline-sulfatase
MTPNILFLHVDQLSAQAIGTGLVDTPNLDRLLRRGCQFTRSYAAEPYCTPARASWMTGRFPSEHGVVFNATSIHPDLPDLGQWLHAHSPYRAALVGKWHVSGRDAEQSFAMVHQGSHWGDAGDADVTRAAQAMLRASCGDRPLFLSVGWLNPHDCCTVWRQDHVHGDPETLDCGIVDRAALPPLPAEFADDGVMPATVEAALPFYRVPFTPLHWRYYLHQYAQLVRRVDAEIGALLDALAASPQRRNTVVIFSSDHGDGLACHRHLGKGSLWDASVRVPLIIASLDDGLGIRQGSATSSWSSGVDLFPTVCDLAGIAPPPGLPGRSLWPLACGRPDPAPRACAYAESMHYARMVRSEHHAYLVDLAPADPRGDLAPPRLATHRIHREILYDHRGAGECRDVSREQPDEILRHRALLRACEADLPSRPLRPEVAARLFQRLDPYHALFR